MDINIKCTDCITILRSVLDDLRKEMLRSSCLSFLEEIDERIFKIELVIIELQKIQSSTESDTDSKKVKR
jgi:hypothetical protein